MSLRTMERQLTNGGWVKISDLDGELWIQFVGTTGTTVKHVFLQRDDARVLWQLIEDFLHEAN